MTGKLIFATGAATLALLVRWPPAAARNPAVRCRDERCRPPCRPTTERHAAGPRRKANGGRDDRQGRLHPRRFGASALQAPEQPEFCRVHARMTPVEGSEIKVQVWLPSDWNGKLVGFGGGGFEGGLGAAAISLREPPSARAMPRSSPTPGTIRLPSRNGALRQPEKIADFGHRANHLGAMFGKSLSAEYYGAAVEAGLLSRLLQWRARCFDARTASSGRL